MIDSHQYREIPKLPLASGRTPEDLLAATKKTREAGYKHVEAYTPFPVEGLSEAVGFKWTAVPLLTLMGGVGGGLTGFGLQYWVAAIAYPFNIGGRPFNSWPAFIPVTFELTVLGASIFAVFGMLALNKLPQPYHPVFNVERFSPGVNRQILFVHRGSRSEIRPGGNIEIPAEPARAARQRGEG